MRSATIRISRTLGVLFVTALAVCPGSTEGSVLDLLKGGLDGKSVEAGAADGPVKRIPFGRDEVQLSFAPLVLRTAPGVVNVYASSKAPPRSPFMTDPFFDRFFGDGMPPRVQSSLGSGVIADNSGLVVTNHHVIRGADEVKVALADGREFDSRILIREESIDLAVLKIGGEDFPALDLGDSDRLEVGDLVLAIGNPFGVGQTTTSGIISVLARSHLGINDFGFFIQTDAAINPGNSGGALIDMSGRVVGINTAIYLRSGGSNGIGFVIPSNMVRGVVDAARNGSDFVERPWIGVAFDVVDAQVAEALGMERPAGALVSDVPAGGPSARTGLRPGDVVLVVDGVEIQHPDALGYRLAPRRIGAVTAFEVLRRGKIVVLDIGLEKAPEGASGAQVTIDGRSPFAGSTVAELSPALARRLGLPENSNGVAIVEIARNSPSHRFGLRPSDIVRELNGEKIAGAARHASLAAERTRRWRFSIKRDGRLLRQTLRY